MAPKAQKKKKSEKPPNAVKSTKPNKKLNQHSINQTRKQQWVFASIVVAVAVAFHFYTRDSKSSSVKAITVSRTETFINDFVCSKEKSFCDNNLLVPHLRSQMAAKDIAGGTTLIKIPRALQIWDLDAVQDFWIQEELKDAKHNVTGNDIDSGAYLAAYLCRRFITDPDEHDPLVPYYEILPTLRQLARHHPTLWERRDLERLIHSKSSTFMVIRSYQDMMDGEYKAFAAVSDNFKEQIALKDYFRMRILVMSRSFGTGVQPDISDEQLKQYKDSMGIDFTMGCRAMVPLLDMYNHHAKPNVEYKYSLAEQAFVVSAAVDGIPAGQEIFNSYGTFTDTHLFAKFGFVNGDGSGHTQASIAVFHRLLDMGLKQQYSYLPSNKTLTMDIAKQQKVIMGRYLQFDDGYSRCIRNATGSPSAYQLKQLKLKHLVRYANRPSSWIVNMKPRNKEAKPPISFDSKPKNFKVPIFDYENLDFDGSKLMSMCRLITLTFEDYAGDAIATLEREYETTSNPIIVKYQTPNLEYRSLMCLARFSGMALSRYGKGFNLAKEIERVEGLNKDMWGNAPWAAAHVQLGEYMTLDLLNRMANSGAKEYTERLSPDNPTMDAMSKIEPIRVHPCEWNLTEDLANVTEL